ncbi:MAG TPA: hypothetical protein VGI10_22770 [Polyangiaceae bacterium]|jgi:hypothetical protein
MPTQDNGAREALEALARLLAPAIARAVVAELGAVNAPGMLDQSASPLGRRRHIAAVRARVARGEPGAAIVGRRHLLAREAVDAELAALAKRPRKAKAAPSDELASLRARYGLARKGAA